MKTTRHFWSHIAQLCSYLGQTLSGKSKHILCLVTLCIDNRAVFAIMWKNIVEPNRPQMTIWRMRIACQITKATHTQNM